MAIPTETLNAQLVAYEVHTGVFKSHSARIAIVVRVKKGHVHFLHLSPDCRIELAASFVEKFLADYPVELYHYPVLRAVRKYASWVRRDHFEITDEARKVINAILSQG
jgi:hypothetical protein